MKTDVQAPELPLAVLLNEVESPYGFEFKLLKVEAETSWMSSEWNSISVPCVKGSEKLVKLKLSVDVDRGSLGSRA